MALSKCYVVVAALFVSYRTVRSEYRARPWGPTTATALPGASGSAPPSIYVNI